MALKARFRRSAKADPDSMNLVEHLRELRRRVVISVSAITIGTVIAFSWYSPILAILMRPYCSILPKGHPCNLLATNLLDGINLRFKVSLYAGAGLALPVVFWQLWRFVTPGLRHEEKRYAVPFMVASVLLFASGASSAYLVLPHALRFLQAVGGAHLTFFYTAPNYLGFILALMAAFGLAFEFPVVLVALELAGVVTPQQLASKRRWAIVSIFAVVALVIPSGDPVSLFAMAVPMCLFYEAAIATGRIFNGVKGGKAAKGVVGP